MVHKFRKTTALVVLAAAAGMLLAKCSSDTQQSGKELAAGVNLGAEAVSADRGAHLVLVGQCNDCHSPKTFTAAGMQIDSSRMLSGHPAGDALPKISTEPLTPGNWMHFSPDLTAIVGPWGMSFTANITSDSATGIGAWTEDHFVNAMRKGKHMGMDNGRPIMPPMPWEGIGKLADDELKSIFAYLKSTPPISNRVHEPFTPDEVRQLQKSQK